MTESVKHTLIAARKLIEKPENWTQGANARNASGSACSANSPAAVCWCLNGAVSRVTGDVLAYLDAMAVLDRVLAEDTVDFNDRKGRTHGEVIEAIDRAIEAAS